jgi:copper chaperone CopZ
VPFQYVFHVEDVTCEKCEARIREALENLPGSADVKLVRTPQDEAEVQFAASQEISLPLIEQAIMEKSAGTTHTYRVRW